MTGQEITISGRDGKFMGYLARPASGNGAGIVVIQEIFGINKIVRDIADGLAARGFFALAPDLFWRIKPSVQLTDKTDAEWQQAFGLMKQFNPDKGVEDIQDSIAMLRGMPGASGKVGAVGYCLGGMLAYLTATRTDADVSVGYYGINIQEKLGEAAAIKRPLMLHIAEADDYVPPPAQEKIIAGLKTNPLVTVHRYAGVNHAFAREGGKNYDKAAADLANSRTAAFLRQNLD